MYGVFSQPDVEDADSDFGIGLDLGFDFNEQIGFGVRGEWAQVGDSNSFISGIADLGTAAATINGVGAGAEGKSATQVTVGPQFAMNDNVTAKLNYTWEQYKANGVDDETFHGVSFNVLAHF